MSVVFIFNAPPNSGKDFACTAMLEHFEQAQHLMFKDQLYKVAAELANVDLKMFKEMSTNRETKEMPSELLAGYSPRQWLIDVSENIIKPQYGKNYFGVQLSNQITSEVVFVSDGGFVEEIAPLTEKHSVYLVQIEREGCSFVGDSRRYITQEEADQLGCKIVKVFNKGDSSFVDNLCSLIAERLAHIDGVNILNPHTSSFPIEKIAAGLSKVCRYSGQIDKFFSVAEHCVVLSNVCKQQGLSLEQQRYALLHDASEAFLQDIPRPLKKLLPQYTTIEKNFSEVIYKAYNVAVDDAVTALDQNIVFDEVSILKKQQPAWKNSYTSVGAVGMINCLTPEQAEIKFLQKYYELFGQ